MKNLFIGIVLQAGLITAVAAMDSQDILWVGQKDFKISDKRSIKFSNLTGYKTKQDAKKKENGILIGLLFEVITEHKSESSDSSDGYFIGDEFAAQAWWIDYSGDVSKISDPNSNSFDKFKKSYDAKTAVEKSAFMEKLKIAVASLLDNCVDESGGYLEFNFWVDTQREHLKFVQSTLNQVDVQDSNVYKFLLFLAYETIADNYAYFKLADQKNDNRLAFKNEFLNSL